VVIQGFQAGADRIDLRALAGNIDFRWVMNHAQEIDGSVVLDLGAEHMTLADVSLASLHADDFLL